MRMISTSCEKYKIKYERVPFIYLILIIIFFFISCYEEKWKKIII